MTSLCTLSLAAGLVASSASADQGNASVTWYTGGSEAVSLSAIKTEQRYSMPFRGTTSLKTLIINVQKGQGEKKTSAIPLDPIGTFNVIYLFNEGPGGYTVTIFGSSRPKSFQYQGIGYFSVRASEAVPTSLPGQNMNRKVLDFVEKSMGATVGRGECWDLAQEALDRNGADWVRTVQFGQLLDPATAAVLPGDIMQFRSVKIPEHLEGGGTRRETLGLPDHTAIVYEVLGPLHYKLAHQNIGGKRFVLTSEINLKNRTGGQYWIYRPVPRLLIP